MSDLYRMVNGEPALSDAGVALLVGVPPAEFKAEIDRQQEAANRIGQTFTFRMPPEWARQGNRIRKEVSAALGYEPGMKDALDYLAARNA